MKNKYKVTEGIATIYLPKGKKTYISASKLDRILGMDVVWYSAYKTNRKEYVQAVDSSKKTIYLHRCVMEDLSEELVVDHIDGNPLNNTDGNLRQLTRAENGQNRHGANRGNSTGIRGLTYNKGKKKYVGRVKIKGVLHIVGYYTEDDFDLARKELEEFRQKHMPYN